MSIVRVGLSETQKFAEGYEAIFGKKGGKRAPAKKDTARKASAGKAPAARKAQAKKAGTKGGAARKTKASRKK